MDNLGETVNEDSTTPIGHYANWRRTSLVIALSLSVFGMFSGYQDLTIYTRQTTNINSLSAVVDDDAYDHANNTIVTAFFPLDTRRHSNDEYTLFMTRLFSNNDAMIIFTTPDFASRIKSMRQKPRRTKIIAMHLNETKTLKMFPPEFWEQHVPQTVQGLGSNSADYPVRVIWNSKIEFLKIGSDQNPFRSNFFAWVDAGLIRWDSYANTTILQRVPPELPRDRFMVMDVTPVLFHKQYQQMAAGLFGGYKKSIDIYYDKYYEKLLETGNSSATAPLLSSEQVMMHNTCTSSPGLCYVVTPRKSECCSPALEHPYFYMLPFCNKKEHDAMKEEGILNPNDGL